MEQRREEGGEILETKEQESRPGGKEIAELRDEETGLRSTDAHRDESAAAAESFVQLVLHGDAVVGISLAVFADTDVERRQSVLLLEEAKEGDP